MQELLTTSLPWPLVFAVLAALAAARHWRSDLVEERRRLRIFAVVTGVIYSLAVLAARLGSPQGRQMGLGATLDVLALLLIVTVLVARLLRLGTTNLFPATEPTAVHIPMAGIPANQPEPTPDLAETSDDGEVETLPPPDPARRDLPVLTLALDAGFQSIGPFNRAFKAATGLTPTEFRKGSLVPPPQNSADF